MPEINTDYYECVSCGARFKRYTSRCPICRGEVEIIEFGNVRNALLNILAATPCAAIRAATVNTFAEGITRETLIEALYTLVPCVYTHTEEED